MKNILFLMAVVIAGNVQADEYPSEETVRFALNCMHQLGGQTDENLYACLCRYDSIRDQMIYTEYEEAVTYERNKAMPGEKGGFFRDNVRGEKFYYQLKEVRKVALAECPVAQRVKLDRTKLANPK